MSENGDVWPFFIFIDNRYPDLERNDSRSSIGCQRTDIPCDLTICFIIRTAIKCLNKLQTIRNFIRYYYFCRVFISGIGHDHIIGDEFSGFHFKRLCSIVSSALRGGFILADGHIWFGWLRLDRDFFTWIRFFIQWTVCCRCCDIFPARRALHFRYLYLERDGVGCARSKITDRPGNFIAIQRHVIDQ